MKERQAITLLNDYPYNYSFNGIDIIKFICSYLVCAVHIKPISGVDWQYAKYFNFVIQNIIGRVAVPFFLVSAGFLLFRKIDCQKIDKNRIKNYGIKLLLLLSIWYILLFLGDTRHLWYLGGTVIALVMITFLLHRNISFAKIGLVTLLLYFFGLLCDSYFGVVSGIFERTGLSFLDRSISFFYDNVSITLRLGLFLTPVFFFMGIVFAWKPIRVRKWIAVLGLLSSSVALFAEACVLKAFSKPLDYNMYASLIPLLFFLFYFVANLKIQNRIIFKKLRTIGVLVFFSHLFFKELLDIMFEQINKINNYDFTRFLFISVIVSSTAFAVLIEYLSHKEKLKWLKYLFS